MHQRQHIANLPAILKEKGVEKIIVSPGSRNAPLIQAFYSVFGNNCISIVDERSAAYFALGIALISKKPAVIISTSGTASLNYAPAIAEAFHQGVPLIAITADRPAEWIDQQDNQTIRQSGIYGLNCKASFEFPLECRLYEDLWFSERIVNETISICSKEKPGPVHINVPLREPLYTELPEPDINQLIDFIAETRFSIPETLKEIWSLSKRILIICGQSSPDNRLNALLNQLSGDKRIVVISEPISNISGKNIINQPDLLLATTYVEDLTPDLVVYFGGQLVSKRLKVFLRQLSKTQFWLIHPSGQPIDTFMHVSKVIQAYPVSVFEELVKTGITDSNSEYSDFWKNLQESIKNKVEKNLKEVPYSDLSAFDKIADWTTSDDIIFLGNSSIIRYMFMFPFKFHSVFSNRGTSGIDGCLSTSAGIASETKKHVYSILGDLSFIYDSNGLWNKNLPPNLKIIVINNQGGNIFELIDGPAGNNPIMPYLKAHHPVDLEMISKAYGLEYSLCINPGELTNSLNWLKNTGRVSILEVKTPGDINPLIFRNFVNKLRE